MNTQKLKPLLSEKAKVTSDLRQEFEKGICGGFWRTVFAKSGMYI